MLKKLFSEFVLVLSILLLVACSNETESGGVTNNNNDQETLSIEEYISSLSDEKTTHLKSQTNLLLHPLKEAFELYGNDCEISWDGKYVKVKFDQAKCSFAAYAGVEFEHYDWFNNYIDLGDCNIMEYVPYLRIEKVLFDVDGKTLTDGISVGMSVKQISEKLNVSGIDYSESNGYIVSEYDDDGNLVDVCYINLRNEVSDYTIVFKEDILDRVEIAKYSKYSIAEETNSDCGKQIINDAFSFVIKNNLATFSESELSYKGRMYSSYYDSWFYGWEFTQGMYEGYVVNVEETHPNRVYISPTVDGHPMLFWCNGEYVDPMLSFLGKWRFHNTNEYIDIKSISKEGIVVFDMYAKVGTNTGEYALIENLSTEFNNIPQNLDAYLFKEYEDGSLVGNIQFNNGEVQSGYYKYGDTRFYLIDFFCMSLKGNVEYITTSGGVGTSKLSIHIPNKNTDYSQTSTWGYMENFGRDDLNADNIILTNDQTGDFVINDCFNAIYETSGIKYAGLEYRYLYDYVFPVNDITYGVWECTVGELPHYLYVDSTNELIIKECEFNSIAKHSKELIYKSDRIVDTKSYANQTFATLDGKIVVDLINGIITKSDSVVDSFELSDITMDDEGKNERFMFFCDIGTRFRLWGYVLFDYTTWGATLHITDSNVPDFGIGVYYLNSETFFLDPSVGVVGVPEKGENDKYIDDALGEAGKETKLVIREFSGKIIGYIYVDEQGKKTVKDFSGKILGYYYPDRDATTDLVGKVLARGDITSALLYQ